MSNTSKRFIPADGLAGLKQNFSKDALSGFLVFLLALPLSLGIAKASDFPAIFGLVTAIIGGVVVSFFMGARLTIKGPAAGLIAICGGAIAAFGGGDIGWHLALGAIVVAGLIQVLFGVFKLGKLADFFPGAAIHGMLAAIGIIIMSKQIHNILGVDPSLLKGKETFELIAMIPGSIMHENAHITEIGVICLVILIGMSLVKNKRVKKIPAPLIVLAVAIPLGIILHISTEEGIKGFADVKIGSIFDAFTNGFKMKGDFISRGVINADFNGLSTHIGVFIQYVVLFSLIGTIESLLTAKAIDGLDPFKRKSNFNKDVIAVGFGNTLSGLLGGLPMISEVARSSANVSNGAATRWANFFHGLFLLVAVLFAVPVIEMIPNAALAAMLTFVGFRLTHPREYIHMWHIGKEQFAVFLVTVVLTLATDLLVGVGGGIVLNIIFVLIKGHKFGNLFKARYTEQTGTLFLKGELSFTNYLGLKKKFQSYASDSLTVDFQNVNYIDHNVMAHLLDTREEWKFDGKELVFLHLEQLVPATEYPSSERRRGGRFEVTLSKRDIELGAFAKARNWSYNPGSIAGEDFRNFGLLSNFTVERAQNIITVSNDMLVADLRGEDRGNLSGGEMQVTALLADVKNLPSFRLSQASVFDSLQNVVLQSDINFENHPTFSGHYKLLSDNEEATRAFFHHARLELLENEKNYEIEISGQHLLVISGRQILTANDIEAMVDFTQRFLKLS